MGVILQRTDFVAPFEVTFPTINGRDTIVENTLNRLEEMQLIKLFGKDLFDVFKLNPTDVIYQPLYEPLYNGRFYSSNIKDVILTFVFIRYQRISYSLVTENGRVLKKSSTSNTLNPIVADRQMINQAVDGWKSLQIYCSKNYANFKGVDKNYLFL